MKYFFIEYLDLGYWPVDNCKAGNCRCLGLKYIIDSVKRLVLIQFAAGHIEHFSVAAEC